MYRIGCIKCCTRCEFERYCLYTGAYPPGVQETGAEGANETASAETLETESAFQDAEPATVTETSPVPSVSPAPAVMQKGDTGVKGSNEDRSPVTETTGANAGSQAETGKANEAEGAGETEETVETEKAGETKEAEETTKAGLALEEEPVILDKLRAFLAGQEPVAELEAETEPASWSMDPVQYGELSSILLLILFGVAMCIGAIAAGQFWKGVNNGR